MSRKAPARWALVSAVASLACCTWRSLLYTAEKCGIPLHEYTPSQVKMAVVGYGKAEKRQVMDMTRRLLRLKSVPRPDDAADALALALCHARSATSRLPQQGSGVKETV